MSASPSVFSSSSPGRPTWIEVDCQALTANVKQIRRRLGPDCLLMAVVKANAYGHGALLAARAFWAAGADRLAVATLGEALELRQGGIAAPIQILGYTPGWQMAEAARHGIIVTVFDLETAQALDAAAASAGVRATLHVKVNTGMNRLGLLPQQAGEFIARLRSLRHVQVEGIFTHFATSDTDRAFAREQFARFTALLDELAAAGLRPPLAHAANSAATLTMPETHLEMVRCGIALYGLDPDVEETPLPPGFCPALAWKAQVAQVSCLQPGDAVSYGREFVADSPMTVAVVPVGYADGFPRRPLTWGSVLIHGEFAPIVGRVCMDQCVVDVTAIAAHRPVRQGDEVVLIGRQGARELSAAEVARRLGTINYDVVSRILSRVPRLPVGEGQDRAD
ncbi:MAG TPA: alanine racemase [Caldilineaceae bacterium]|nr:alanine racemase [Caldilineaceae bacterium]